MSDLRDRLRRRLARTTSSAPGGVTVLREPDGAPPDAAPRVVLVHPVGGGLLCYRQLVGAAGDDVRVLGIEARREVLARHDGAPLRALAAEYLDLVPAGTGRTVFAGWSHGGLIAWEMAAELRERGADPAGVVLFDTVWPRDPEAPLAPEEEMLRWFRDDLARTNGRDPDGDDGGGSIARVLGLDDDTFAGLREVFLLNTRAFMRHTPTPARFPVTLVTAGGTDPSQVRGRTDREPAVTDVPDCDHYSLLYRASGVDRCARALRDACEVP